MSTTTTTTTTTRVIYGIPVDEARGYDVMRGSKVMRHFDTYEEAAAYVASKRRCYYLRYWGAKKKGE